VSREECKKLREGVPYVKIYRYSPKHLYPKLNGYGDNGQRKVWTSFGFHTLYVVGLAAYLHCAYLSLSGAQHGSRSHIHVHVRLSVCAGVVITTEVEVSYVLRIAKMPFVFSHVEYCDMHFVYGFCDGNGLAAEEEYRRRYPDRRIPSSGAFTRIHQTLR
jgi:hypothetical protein